MTELYDIKEFCKNWKETLKNFVDLLDKPPMLKIIQVGDVEASNRYVRNKVKDCEEIGIVAKVLKLPDTIGTNDLVSVIFDEQYECDGLIVQLPLPKHIDLDCVKKAIDPNVDVDGFAPGTLFKSCTPFGIVHYLNYNMELRGKNVCVIGRSDLVGKPLAQMLTDADATVTLCHSETKNLYQHIFNADLIVCAVGKAKFLNCYPIQVPVIDVGINFDENGKLVGDCYNTEGRNVTPVPGGVGLLTRCALMNNVVSSAVRKQDELYN